MKMRVELIPSDEGGFTVTVPGLRGCISEGDSREDALKNIREAILLYFDTLDEDYSAMPDTELCELTV
ncbi:MAG: type II toxin-antitoxin system HicB family antitoxin [Verrucomicrobiota bacterium]